MYTKMCRKVSIALSNLKDDARGVSAIEYAILAAVIIGVVYGGVQALNLGDVFSTIGSKLTSTVNQAVQTS
jgi:Flp pilus assembly pilin Flp